MIASQSIAQACPGSGITVAVRSGLAVLGLIVSGIAAGQGPAPAGGHPALQDRWSLQLGAFLPEVETSARLDSTTFNIGTEISFEDDLGLDDRETLPYLLAGVRLGERWKLEFEYFALDRSGVRAISRTISWGDFTFPIGTTVSSEFNSSVYRLSGGYSFIKDGQGELGVALGLFTTDFEASLAGPNIGARVADALAPLPTIGLYGAYAFSPQWLLSGRADYFSLDVDDYDGSLLSLSAGVDYRFSRHFGVGVSYRYVDYELDVTASDFTGNVNYEFSGPLFYVVTTF